MTRQVPTRTGRAALHAGAVATLAVATLALTGCSGGEQPPASVAAAATPSARATTVPATPAPTRSSGKTSTGRSTAPPPQGGLPAAPAIVYFRVAESPACPSADDPDGRPVTVEWKVTGVSTVTISVDGPGIYDEYPRPKGTATFTFPCSGSAGSRQKHTYMLSTGGEIARKTRTITVSAAVHQG
jgi:hypothetical protein